MNKILPVNLFLFISPPEMGMFVSLLLNYNLSFPHLPEQRRAPRASQLPVGFGAAHTGARFTALLSTFDLL